jgi:hypothetical protein
MLGRESVIDRECAGVRGTRDSGDHRAMGLDRSRGVAAAVQIKDHAILHRAGSGDPFGLDAAGAHRLASHVGSDAFADALHASAPLGHRGIWIRGL